MYVRYNYIILHSIYNCKRHDSASVLYVCICMQCNVIFVYHRLVILRLMCACNDHRKYGSHMFLTFARRYCLQMKWLLLENICVSVL